MDRCGASGCADGGSDDRLQIREGIVIRKNGGDLLPISLDLQGLRFEKFLKVGEPDPKALRCQAELFVHQRLVLLFD